MRKLTIITIIKIAMLLALAALLLAPAQAQTFELQEIVLGNQYDRDNPTFQYETPWYYNWEVKVNRVDNWGGDIKLHVTVKSKPDCKRVYQIIWALGKDVSTLNCGEEVLVNVINRPISGGDCEWDWVEINPSSLAFNHGASGMTYPEVAKDPMAAYREYVFLHYPGHVIQGEPQFTDQEGYELHYANNLVLTVCSRADMANSANGGNFHLHLDGRGVNFDIDYIYSKAVER